MGDSKITKSAKGCSLRLVSSKQKKGGDLNHLRKLHGLKRLFLCYPKRLAVPAAPSPLWAAALPRDVRSGQTYSAIAIILGERLGEGSGGLGQPHPAAEAPRRWLVTRRTPPPPPRPFSTGRIASLFIKATCGSESPRPPHGARRAGAGLLRPERGRGAAGDGVPAPPYRFPTPPSPAEELGEAEPPSQRHLREEEMGLPSQHPLPWSAPEPFPGGKALACPRGTDVVASAAPYLVLPRPPLLPALRLLRPRDPHAPRTHGLRSAPSRGTRHLRGAGALHTTRGRSLGCCGVLRAGVSASAPPLVAPPPLPGAPPRSARCWVWSAAPPPDGRAGRRREGGGSSDTHTRAAGPARPQPRPPAPPPAAPPARPRGPPAPHWALALSRIPDPAPRPTPPPLPRRGAGGIPGAPRERAASWGSEASNGWGAGRGRAWGPGKGPPPQRAGERSVLQPGRAPQLLPCPAELGGAAPRQSGPAPAPAPHGHFSSLSRPWTTSPSPGALSPRPCPSAALGPLRPPSLSCGRSRSGEQRSDRDSVSIIYRLCIASAKVRLRAPGLAAGLLCSHPFSVCSYPHLETGDTYKETHGSRILRIALCALKSPVYTLKFHVGQEYGAFPLSCAALNRLVCLPNKPWLDIRISSTSPTCSGKQTKSCFQNLNFPISALQASSAKNRICNHRTHFYIEAAK